MRTEPAWTSYPYQTVLSWIATFIIAALVVLAAECAPPPAHADTLYLDAGIGMTQFIPTVEDGTWYQQPLPHRWLTQAPAFKVGLGYTINDRWSVQLDYMDFGKAKVRASVVDDPLYDPKAHQCKPPCAPVGYIKVHDHYYGPQLVVNRAFQTGPWTPYLKGGAALIFHRVQMDSPTDAQLLNFSGAIPMLVVGGGVQRGWLYADLTYYHGPGGSNNCVVQQICGHPISKEFALAMVGVRVPLAF